LSLKTIIKRLLSMIGEVYDKFFAPSLASNGPAIGRCLLSILTIPLFVSCPFLSGHFSSALSIPLTSTAWLLSLLPLDFWVCYRLISESLFFHFFPAFPRLSLVLLSIRCHFSL
jgi:hypothetical protein